MYTLKYLEYAKRDVDNIVYYISNNLKNETAAYKFIELYKKEIINIKTFPYGSSIYEPTRKLKKEYRCSRVKNYLIFYIVNENKKEITIVRILYKRRNILELLNK